MAELQAKLTTVQGLGGSLSSVQCFSATLSNNINIKMQSKDVTPTDEEQVIVADAGFVGLSSVKIAPIPNNYGLITWDGSTLTVS